MVDVDAGPEAVRAYVREQAELGLEHVRALLRKDRDAMARLLQGLSEREAAFKPDASEFSILEVLQHLDGSFARSLDRLRTLSSGHPWSAAGGPVRPGSIPAEAPASFSEAKLQFLEGEEAVLAVLDAAEPSTGLDLTAPHASFGHFNWLEWAVYSHHVHLRDHIGQVTRLRRLIEERGAAV